MNAEIQATLALLDEMDRALSVCEPIEHCANSNKSNRCHHEAQLGHIYCKPCRLATGGYDRYNPAAPKSA
jgi:hypothetical protein